MFTGLVEEVGRVRSTRSRQSNRLLEVEAGIAGQMAPADSIAVNGCCLTVVRATSLAFTAEAIAATLKATNLGGVRPGARVNLERALKAGDRLGGHFVQGHVDELGTVTRIGRQAGSWRLAISVSPRNSDLLVDRGSVCVDGISLTVAATGRGQFEVNVIPHTWESTNLSSRRTGDKVNVEYDLLVRAARQGSDSRTGR